MIFYKVYYLLNIFYSLILIIISIDLIETIIIINKVVNLLVTIIASSYRNKIIIYLKI